MKISLRFLLGVKILASVMCIAACELPPVRVIHLTNGREAPARPAENSKRENTLRDDRNEHIPSPSASRPENSSANSDYWFEVVPANDTFLKSELSDSSLLSHLQKCPLPRGTRHNLAEPPVTEGNHLRVTLKKQMAGCALLSGFVFTQHVGRISHAATSPAQEDDKNPTLSSQATLYTTENTPMEGGPKDRCGRPLRTLDDYLSGHADYVSVAMDTRALPYGTLIRIPELDQKFLQSTPIPFKVVDTGSAFTGHGTRRMDICVGHSQSTLNSSKYIWISHKTFTFHIIEKGESFDCR